MDIAQKILEAVLLYGIIYSLCRLWGCRNVTKWRALRPAVFGVILLALGQYATESDLFSRAGVPVILCVLLWTLPYGWVRGHVDGKENKDFSRMKGEIFVGSAGAVMILLLQDTAMPAAADVASLVFLLLSLATAISYVVYYVLFHAMFNTGDMVPVLLTDRKEAVSFARSEIGLLKCAAIFVAVIAVAAIGWMLLGRITLDGTARNGNIIAWGTFILAAALFLQYIRQAYPVKQIWSARAYIATMRENSAWHARNLEKLSVTCKSGKPGTTVLIIGESANRDHMRCFHPEYPVETTPWESAMKDDPNFYFFNNAYACFSQTAEVLPYLLSGMNQYNHTSPDYLISLIDISKAAGMDTWWLTNHGDGDTVTQTLAQCADHAQRTQVTKGDDAQLLALLEQIPAQGFHFIVVHIMGSHIRYEDRVPSDFTKIRQPGADKKTSAYDTTIAYTDSVLERICKIATERLHADTILYVSDHGEDMKYTHGTGHFTWDMVRIPMWIYLSTSYRQAHPGTAATLARYRDGVFTNDLVFDTLSGLMGLSNYAYTEKFGLCSPAYRLTREGAVTMYGERKVAEDTACLS